MASNLLLSPMTIPAKCMHVTASSTVVVNDGNLKAQKPEDVLFGKNRDIYSGLAANSTALSYTFDLGADTRTADHIIITRADKMTSDTVQVLVRRSSDNISYTTESTITLNGSTSLVNPSAQDSLHTFTLTSAYRYWKLELTATASKFKSTAFYLGAWFDFDIDPSQWSLSKISSKDPYWVSEAGDIVTSQSLPERYKLVCTWNNITDAKLTEFRDDYLSTFRKHGIYIYSANSAMLDGSTLLHCDVTDFKYERKWIDKNIVTLEFTELY